MRVLIVEGNPLVAMLLEEAVRAAGHEPVGPALDGRSGLERAKERPVDLAFVDEALDKRSGFNAEEIVEVLSDGQDCPCVFVSSHAAALFGRETKAAGVLEKPFTPGDVGQVLTILGKGMPVTGLTPDLTNFFLLGEGGDQSSSSRR